VDDANKPKRKAKGKTRRYGDGSIYPAPSGNGLIVQVYDGRGRLQRRRAATPEAAEALRQELVRQRDGGVDLQAGNQTMQVYLSMWLRDVAIPRGIKPKTELHYRATIERYILPFLSERRLNDVKPADVQALLNHLRKHELSDQTVRHAYTVLKDALNTAERWRYIDRNPAALVQPPKMRRRTVEPLTAEEAQALLKTVADHQLALLYHIALTLGLRQAELLGLQWRDIDLDKLTLTVARQVQTLPKHGTTLVSPKSESSVRLLPLPAGLAARLQRYQVAEKQRCLKAGQVWRGERLLFGTSTEKPTIPRNLLRHYYRARAAASIRDTANFHILRHTVGAALVEAGVNEATIGAILGHSRGSVTRRYSHSSQTAMRAALELVEKMFLREAA
jgi:integrase